MKKIILLLAFACLGLTSSAQRARSTSTTTLFSVESADQPVTFGVRAGLNFASFRLKNLNDDIDGRTSFHTGLSVDIPILKSFYVQSGLYLSSKGASYEEKEDDEKYSEVMSPLYLEIPILASYRYDFNESTQLQFNVGPYFSYGIGGKWEEEESYNGRTEKNSSDFFDDDEDDFDRFDAGLQIGVGVTLSQHFFLGAAYQIGVVNITGTGWRDDVSIKNNNFMVSLGYNF